MLTVVSSCSHAQYIPDSQGYNMVPQLNRSPVHGCSCHRRTERARGATTRDEARRATRSGADEDWRLDDAAPDPQDGREALPVVDGRHSVSVRKWFPSYAAPSRA